MWSKKDATAVIKYSCMYGWGFRNWVLDNKEKRLFILPVYIEYSPSSSLKHRRIIFQGASIPHTRRVRAKPLLKDPHRSPPSPAIFPGIDAGRGGIGRWMPGSWPTNCQTVAPGRRSAIRHHRWSSLSPHPRLLRSPVATGPQQPPPRRVRTLATVGSTRKMNSGVLLRCAWVDLPIFHA